MGRLHPSLSHQWMLWLWLPMLWNCISGQTLTTKASIQSCRSEHENGVHWYSTSFENQISSDPLCLDDAKFLQTRECTRSGWVPQDAPQCPHTQNVRSVYDNFAKFSGYDLFVIGENAAVYRSKKKQWSQDCIKFGFTEDILQYQNYFTMHPDYFWLPVRRYKPYYPHIWNNLGKKFGEVTNEYLDLGSEDCLVINFSSNHVKSVPCTDSYPELCLYVYVSPLLELSCPKGFYTTRFKRDETKCYQVSERDCNTYFRYSDPYDRILYRGLMDEYESEGNCRIEIDPFPQKMLFDMDFWKANIANVSYVNWSPSVNRNYNPQLPTYTYADKEGDWLLGSSYRCTVCEQNLRSQTPRLQLTFNTAEQRIELSVANPEFLWSEDPEEPHIACFVLGSGWLLRNVIILDELYNVRYRHGGGFEENVVGYEVQGWTRSVTEYWCEAVSHPSFEIISSNHLVHSSVKEGVIFALQVVHQCRSKCLGVYDVTELGFLEEQLLAFLKTLDLGVEFHLPILTHVVNSNASRETLLFQVVFENTDLLELIPEISLETQSEKEFLRDINLIHYLNQKLEKHVDDYQWDTEFTINQFHPMFFCVSEVSISGERRLLWAGMNEIRVIPNLCMDDDFAMSYARCEGEFPSGVQWNRQVDVQCRNDTTPPRLTGQLFHLVSSGTISVQEVQELDVAIQEKEDNLNPADVFLLGSLIGRFAQNVSEMIPDPSDLMVFTRIFSQSMEINADQAEIGHRHMNATNLMLDNYERLIQRASLEMNIFQSPVEREIGVAQLRTKKCLTFMIDPAAKNITGVAFFLQKEGEEFESAKIEFLFGDQNEEELLKRDDLEGAAFLPLDVLEGIKSNFTGTLRIVVSIMKNDILFQNRENDQGCEPAGRIITASIPNYDRPLPGLFLIMFRPRRQLLEEGSHLCGYWNFHPPNKSRTSEWSTMGCSYLGKSTSREDDPVYMCGCQHFTNFAFLLTGNNLNSNSTETKPLVPEKIRMSLDVITQVGCVLSLVGVLLIWLTAIVFRSWREREGTKVLLQLSFGIGLQVLLFLFINLDEQIAKTTTACITIGILLHYSVLVIFAWMLITAYLQYLRYVVVFGNLLPKHFFLKANLVGWCIPILPILVICLINPGMYVPENAHTNLHNIICYPQGNALYFGVMLPISLVIVANLCVYGLVIYNITIGLQKCNNHRKNNNKIHQAQLRLTILLFFLLGITWIFGLLVHIEFGTYVFTYIFVILGTMQGFVLFVYFIILDPQTRKLWLSRFSCCYKKEFTSSTYNS